MWRYTEQEAVVKNPKISALFAILVLGVTVPSFAQATQSDSQTLQAILSEVRGMHNDMRTTAISQILLTELQTQQTVVNAATERVSNARLQFSNLQAAEKHDAAALASTQEKLADGSDPSLTKEQLSDGIDHFKSELIDLKTKEEGSNTNLQAAENQLRSAQDNLDDIQQRLDATVKKLQPIADMH